MEPMGPETPTPPAAPPPPTGGGSGKAVTTLVLGILSIVCCGLLGPVAWVMGNGELKAIAAGTSPSSNETMAKIGKILGIIGTVLLVLSLVWVFFAGGMAVLQGVMGN
ncbi:MAG: DUF4190 domain-containing protein [Thermoanaerobaculia bacterium]